MHYEVTPLETNTHTNGTSNGHHRSFANVKTFITNEIMMYFYGSIFTGFFISMVLYFYDWEQVSTIVFGFSASFLLFFGLVKLNNKYFTTDRQRIRDLFLANKNDSLNYILTFERDLSVFVNRPDGIDKMTELFVRIFTRDEAEQYVNLMMKSTDILRFLSALPPIAKERLYRFYAANQNAHLN